MNLILLFTLLAAFQEQGGGIRTPEMDPNRNPVDMAKEFPKINRRADAVLKRLRSFTASVKQENRKENSSLEGSLKAKSMKGKLWVLMTVADHPGGWTQENIAEKKVTELWPAEKIYRRTDYKRERKTYPVEIFYATQYRPSKLTKDFTIQPLQMASDYRKVNKKADDAPEDDPLLKKARKFENPEKRGGSLRNTGPDPKVYHAVNLTPRSSVLRETMAVVRIWFHYKTFLISRVEVYGAPDGQPVLVSNLTDYRVGVDLKNSEVLIKTVGWKKKSN